MIFAKDETFIIDQKPQLIYGGELHYFRTPKDKWLKLIKKIKAAGCNLVSTYIPWCWHEYEEGTFDFEGTTRNERDLVSFLSLLKQENMYCVVRPGPYVMAEIKFEGIPTWIIKNYPQVIAKEENGDYHPSKVISYMHPQFLIKVKCWYKSVCSVLSKFQIGQGGTIIMFQLDNEVGMLQWVTNQGDYNSATMEYLEKFLIEEYGCIENFNSTYMLNCLEISEGIKQIIDNKNAQSALRWAKDFGNFSRKYFADYIEKLRDYSKEFGIEVPYIVNVHGFTTVSNTGRGNEYAIGLSQLYKAVKIKDIILAGDYYIRNITYDNFHDIIIDNAFTKAIQNPDQPLFSAEFQSGGLMDRPRLQPSDIELSTRVTVASGMNAINYYMFVSGENYEDMGLFGRRHEWQAPLNAEGEERPHYAKIKYMGEVLNTFKTELLKTKKAVDTYIGFYPDYYMTEYKNDLTAKVIDEISQFRESYQFDGIVRSLTLANISYEAIDLMDVTEINPDLVPSLWMFSTNWMDEKIQIKLLNYVENGGKLVLYPTIPRFNMVGEECTILLNAMETTIKETKSGWTLMNIEGMDTVFSNYRVILEEFKGEPIAWYEEDGIKEYAGFTKQIGLGKLVFLGVGMEHEYDYKLDLIKKLALEVDVKTAVSCSDNWTNVLVRENVDTALMFINNFDEYNKVVTIDYHKNQCLKGKELLIPARGGLLLPICCRINEDLEIKYSTCEIVRAEEKDLNLTLCVSVHKEVCSEILFSSKQYKPIMSEGIIISRLPGDLYLIKVNGLTGTVEIYLEKYC
jgi:beta-galactosidase